MLRLDFPIPYFREVFNIVMRRNLIGAHMFPMPQGGVYLVGLSATDTTFYRKIPAKVNTMKISHPSAGLSFG
jgi:hypothetical protein